MRLKDSINKEKVGQRFGKRTQIGPSFMLNDGPTRHRFAVCECDCGEAALIAVTKLYRGLSRACNSCRQVSHGLSRAPEYRVWAGMIGRCTDENHDHFSSYGGRGIKVCERWLRSFKDFRCDVGDRPSLDHQLDRIDNDGNYEPGNVQWLSRADHWSKHRHRRPVDRADEVDVICSSWC